MDVTDRPEVSVVVVSFNTRDLLCECLQTLGREAGGVAYETIVIDNASTDGSAEMVAARFPAARLIRSTVNLGFGGANNRGFAVARGRYLVLLNSDAFLMPGALPRSVAHMDAHPEVGLGGGSLVGRDGAWQPSARLFPSPLNDFLIMSGMAGKFPQSRLLGRADRTWADPQAAAAVDWIPGAYSIIRRAPLAQVGYFDERFFLYYEEVDLCRRLKAAGHQVWWWPDIVTRHLGGESSKTVAQLKFSTGSAMLELWRMRSALLYYRKHHGAAGAWSVHLLESSWNRLRALRNRVSAEPRRGARVADFRENLGLMQRAWTDTRGGRVSPPRPW